MDGTTNGSRFQHHFSGSLLLSVSNKCFGFCQFISGSFLLLKCLCALDIITVFYNRKSKCDNKTRMILCFTIKCHDISSFDFMVFSKMNNKVIHLCFWKFSCNVDICNCLWPNFRAYIKRLKNNIALSIILISLIKGFISFILIGNFTKDIF